MTGLIDARRSGEPTMGDVMKRSSVSAIAYVLGWVVAAAVVAVVALVVLDGSQPEVVSVPPIHETELHVAARAAGCDLRHASRVEALNPPVNGSASAEPTPPGFYDSPQQPLSLVAALRRGVVVIQFQDRLDGHDEDLLKSIQKAAPTGTIVAPNDTGMRYAVAATAYRRLLGCRALDKRSIDALQLFRGRFVGAGPD
jgi:hypothetical protein